MAAPALRTALIEEFVDLLVAKPQLMDALRDLADEPPKAHPRRSQLAYNGSRVTAATKKFINRINH